MDKLFNNHMHYPRELRGILVHYKPNKVFAGCNFSGILTTDGKLLTFGLGVNGQLGHLDSENKPFEFLFTPKRVDSLDDYFVEDVSLGSCHAFAIARKRVISKDEETVEYESQRMVFAWGLNSNGQCGTGDFGLSLLPRQLKAFSDHNMLKVSAGDTHTLFIAEKDNEKGLYSCGNAVSAATALTKTLKGSFNTPIRITSIDKFRKLSKDSPKLSEIYDIKAGKDTSFAILESN